MSTRTLSIVHKIDGVLTDFDSTPVLRDPTLAYGVKAVLAGTVIVAANTSFVHDGTGLYSYVVTGLTAGLGYIAFVERVYLGETKRSSTTWTAGVTDAEGYYAKHAKMQRRAGIHNLALYSQLDNDATSEDEDNLQNAMDEADRYVDIRARVLRATADTDATSPRMIGTANVYFERISDLASDIAVALIYSARGFTGDSANVVEGQMADMDKKARAELDEIFGTLRVDQLAAAGATGGIEVIQPCHQHHHRGLC